MRGRTDGNRGEKGAREDAGGGRERIREEQTRYRKIQRGKSRREVAGRTEMERVTGRKGCREHCPGNSWGKAVGKGFQGKRQSRMKAKKAVPPCRTAPNRNEPALLFRLVDLAKLLEEFFELTHHLDTQRSIVLADKRGVMRLAGLFALVKRSLRTATASCITSKISVSFEG